MSTINFDGGESGNTGPAAATSGTFSVQGTTTAGAWSKYALRCNPAATAAGWAVYGTIAASGARNTTDATVAASWARLKFLFNTAPAAGDEPFASSGASTTVAQDTIEFRLNSAGKIAVYDVGTLTLQGTGATVLSSGTWYRIELKVDGSDSVNTVWEVKVNGAVELSGSFAASSAPSFLRLGKTVNRNGQAVDFYYDDWLVSNSAYPGDGRCAALTPSANGTFASGTAAGTSPAATLWQSCDDLPNDGDTTVVNAIGNANACTFTLTASGAGGSDTVNSVKGIAFVRRDGASNGSMKLRVRSSTTNSDTTGLTTTASYAATQKILDTDPATSAAWAVSAVNAAEVGVVENSASASRVTAAYLMVDYTPAAAASTTAWGWQAEGASFRPDLDTIQVVPRR